MKFNAGLTTFLSLLFILAPIKARAVGSEFQVEGEATSRWSTPKASSVSGSPEAWFSNDPSSRGSFAYSLPFSWESARSPLLFSFTPTWTPGHGLSEWGHGFQSPIKIKRVNLAHEIDFQTDVMESPWGLLKKASDGFWYIPGLSTRVRVEVKKDNITALLSTGIRLDFAALNPGDSNLVWSLIEATDPKGYVSVYRYDAHGKDQVYLSEISWGVNKSSKNYSIRIHYDELKEEGRWKSYLYGGSVRTLDKRVDRVDFYRLDDQNERLRWSFLIGYQNDEKGPAFYLNSVTKVFSSGEADPSTRFEWGSASQFLSTVEPAVTHRLDKIKTKVGGARLYPQFVTLNDFNHDGLMDLEVAQDQSVFLQNTEGFLDASPRLPVNNIRSECRKSRDPMNTARNVIAMGGNAAEDLVVVQKSNAPGKSTLILCHLNGEISDEIKLDGDFGTDSRVRIADLNKDGRPDLIRLLRGKYEIALNESDGQGIRFSKKVTFSIDSNMDPSEADSFFISDWNGDGFVDLILVRSGFLNISYGKGNLVFGPETFQVQIFDSSGRTFPFQGQSLHPIDANEDGLTDLLVTKDGRFSLLLNNGTNLRESDLSRLQAKINFNKFIFADLLGEGRSQLIQVTNDGQVKALSLTSVDNGMLKTIRDGFGNSYQLAWDVGPPAPRLLNRNIVLKKIILKGAAENSREIEYSYADPVVHSDLPFFLGFATAIRNERGQSTSYTFLQSNDIQGLLLSKKTKNLNRPNLVRVEEQVYAESNFLGLSHQRLIQSKEGWETASSDLAVSSIRSYNQFDENECPGYVKNDAGALHQQTSLDYDSSENFPLLCSISRVDIKADGADTMHWKYERNRFGQVERIHQIGRDDTVIQEMTFDDSGRVLTQSHADGKKSSFAYDGDSLLMRQNTNEFGVIRSAEFKSDDSIEALIIENSGQSIADRFVWDSKDRLAGVAHDLYPIPEGRFQQTFKYRSSTRDSPGVIQETRLTSENIAFDSYRLSSGLGSDTFEINSSDDGFAALNSQVEFAEVDRKNFFAPINDKTDPWQWTWDSFRNHGAKLRTTTQDNFGALQDDNLVETGVPTQTRQFLEIDGDLLKSTTRINDNFSKMQWTDGAGLVRRISLENHSVYEYTYDTHGRLIEVKLPSGKTAALAYDEKGRKHTVARSGLGHTEYLYNDSTSLLANITFFDSNNAVIRSENFDYDNKGRMISVKHHQNEQEINYTQKFDGETDDLRLGQELGNLTFQEGPDYKRWFEHSLDGRLIRTTTEYASQLRLRESFTYSWNGTITSQKVEFTNLKSGFSQNYSLRYKEDRLGRIAGIYLNESNLFQLSYDSINRLSSIKNGQNFTRNATFDSTTKRELGWSGKIQDSDLSYLQHYDERGLIKSQDFTWNQTAKQKLFAYNAVEALSEENTAIDSSQFNYDEDGLRIATQSFQDASGRGIYTKNHTLSYGPNGQIDSAVNPSGLIRYGYDLDGNRVVKIKNGEFVSAFAEMFLLKSDIIYQRIEVGGHLLGVLENGVFRPLPADSIGTPFSFEKEKLEVASAFGESLNVSFSEAVAFARQGRDPDTGLTRFGVRDYDSETGEFITPDPLLLNSPELCINNPLECNLYSYAKNNPLKYIDPSGLLSFDSLTPVERNLIRGNEAEYNKGMAAGALIGGSAVGVVFAPAALTALGAYSSEASLTLLLRAGAFSSAGIKATEFATNIIYGLADAPRSVIGQPALKGVAIAAANDAMIGGQVKGAASALITKSGQVITGVTSEATSHSKEILGLLMSLPKESRFNFSGDCAEIAAIEKGLNSGASLSGALVETVSVGSKNLSKQFSKHGLFKPACLTCSNIMESLEMQFK